MKEFLFVDGKRKESQTRKSVEISEQEGVDGPTRVVTESPLRV